MPRRGPTPGWKGWHGGGGWNNPRQPAVPATLHINLDQYFAAAALMGLIAAQEREPNKQWASRWSIGMGRQIARDSARPPTRRGR